MESFIQKVKELPEFNDVDTMDAFEKKYQSVFKNKCTKCKKQLYINSFSKKNDGKCFKLCDNCRSEMRVYMQGKSKSMKIIKSE